MAKQQIAEYGMWTFILAVIVAGLFGPWVISVLLSSLAALCVRARYRDAAPARKSGPRPHRRQAIMSRLSM